MDSPGGGPGRTALPHGPGGSPGRAALITSHLFQTHFTKRVLGNDACSSVLYHIKIGHFGVPFTIRVAVAKHHRTQFLIRLGRIEHFEFYGPIFCWPIVIG
jgi:hypothetical protein